jgi:hypothetical protein
VVPPGKIGRRIDDFADIPHELFQQSPENILCGLQDNGSMEYIGSNWIEQTGGDGEDRAIHPVNDNIRSPLPNTDISTFLTTRVPDILISVFALKPDIGPHLSLSTRPMNLRFTSGIKIFMPPTMPQQLFTASPLLLYFLVVLYRWLWLHPTATICMLPISTILTAR